MEDPPTPFQMSRITVRGGIGAAPLIAVLIGSMLAEVPLLRGPTLAAVAAGFVLAVALIARHRGRPLDARTPPVSLDLSEAPGPPR